MASKLHQRASWLGRRWASQLAAKPPPLTPRVFPTSGFLKIGASTKMEEERMKSYKPEHFYPVRLGEVFQSQYQVVAKLGFGRTSTTWLGHDLHNRKYVYIKVFTNAVQKNREPDVYEHMKKHAPELGPLHIRPLEDSFKVQGPHGSHEILVQVPVAKSLVQSQSTADDFVLSPSIVKSSLKQVVSALDFLHSDAHVIHTGKLSPPLSHFHAGNLFTSFKDLNECLPSLESAELTCPRPRKVLEDRTIYGSRGVFATVGPMYLCNFGQARIGDQATGNAMATSYRAPEIILGMKWSYPVDMWSVGLSAWDMLHAQTLFAVYHSADQKLNDARHLAYMIALFGPPPLDYLKRSDKYLDFWDEHGDWRGIVPIPHRSTFENLERQMEGEEQTRFLDFMRSLLGWEPEKRLTAKQALSHPWLLNDRYM